MSPVSCGSALAPPFLNENKKKFPYSSSFTTPASASNTSFLAIFGTYNVITPQVTSSRAHSFPLSGDHSLYNSLVCTSLPTQTTYDRRRCNMSLSYFHPGTSTALPGEIVVHVQGETKHSLGVRCAEHLCFVHQGLLDLVVAIYFNSPSLFQIDLSVLGHLHCQSETPTSFPHASHALRTLIFPHIFPPATLLLFHSPYPELPFPIHPFPFYPPPSPLPAISLPWDLHLSSSSILTLHLFISFSL